MQKSLFSSLLLASVSASLNAQAVSDDEISLPETLVTATRSDTLKQELAAASTVYTREDIERLQVRTLPDLLKGSAGVDVVQNGGYGQPSSIFMRGTDPSHVLVLIDGIKAGSVSLGTTAFELLPVDQIERVEIIRGPQSSLYGSEAIGGVIQIFTRKAKQTETPSVSLSTGGGSWDTHREAGNISGRWQNNWYSFGVSNLESKGFAPEAVAPIGVANRGGYNNTAVNARVGHQFDNKAKLEAFFMRAEGDQQFPGFDVDAPNHKQFVNQVVGTAMEIDVIDRWHSSLTFGQTLDEGENLGSSTLIKNSIFNTTRWNASWLNQLILSDKHTAIFGTDYRVDELNGNQEFTKKSRYDVGVFGELHSKLFDRHFFNGSLRWDQNQAFGDYVTGNIGWRFNWDYGLSAFASFGNAFKAPTFNDLYYPLDAWGYYGNPSLKPENSKTTEVGLIGEYTKFKWELRAYHTDIDKLITWSGYFTPVNVNKAQIDGIEAEISTDTWGWIHKLNGNLLSPRDRQINNRLIGRADKTMSYDLSKRFGKFDVGANVLAQSDRPGLDVNYAPTTVAGFVTLDFRTAYHIDKNWMISGKLNNILDKHYQTVSNYNMADRNFFLSIHYNN